MRRTLATAAVVALLLLVAGCNAGGDATTTPAYDPDVEPVYETPLDADRLAAAQLDALREQETFTIDRNNTWTNGDGERVNQSALIRGNVTTGAVYEHVRVRDTTRQTYRFGNGTAYYQMARAGELSYGTIDRRKTNATQYAKGGLPVVVDVFEFEYAGAKSVDGERVYVYRASSLDPDRSKPVPYVYDVVNGSVNRAEATLEFGEDGTLRCGAYTLQFDAEDGSEFVSTDWCFEEVGDTDASPPGWISTARNASE